MSSNNAHLIDTQFSLIIDVTYRCNGSCSYCQWSTNQKARVDDEPDSYILIPKKTIESLGVERVVLSGGEPLIRNDLEKIISYYAQTGVKSIILITNGLILTEERLDSLLSAGLTGIAFSLDGISDRVAFKARGLSKEQHGLVLDNISKALQRRKLYDNIEIGINTVISKANLDAKIMSELVDFCNFHSVDCLKFNPLFDDGFVSKNAPWMLLDEKDTSKMVHIGEMVVRNCRVKTNNLNFWTALASVLERGELDATSCGLKNRQAIAIRGDIKFCFWNNNAEYGQTSDQLNIENVMQARKRFVNTIHLCQTGTYCFCLQDFNHQWRMANVNHN
jgi:molybdenum cofactor biosynthesis enzyme MoaA